MLSVSAPGVSVRGVGTARTQHKRELSITPTHPESRPGKGLAAQSGEATIALGCRPSASAPTDWVSFDLCARALSRPICSPPAGGCRDSRHAPAWAAEYLPS